MPGKTQKFFTKLKIEKKILALNRFLFVITMKLFSYIDYNHNSHQIINVYTVNVVDFFFGL